MFFLYLFLLQMIHFTVIKVNTLLEYIIIIYLYKPLIFGNTFNIKLKRRIFIYEKLV